MTYAFYRFATMAASPFMPLYLRARLKRGKEDAARIHERLGFASAERPAGALAWLHAASVGEANAVLPLIDALRAQYPSLSLLLTTGTVTSARLMAQRLPPGVIHQFAPLDTPPAVARFLSHWKPDVALWVESELWPNLVLMAHASGCRLALVNARLSERSFRRWQRAPALARRMLSCFHLVAAQSAEDAARLSVLGARAEDFGNLKYDAAPLPADAEMLKALSAQIGERPVWLAASTHAGEERIAADVHLALRAQFPNLLTLIAPRHPPRGGEVARELKALGLSVQLRSRQAALSPETDIYVADTLGELGIWYRICPIAFIGGSLAPIGGHNPLEAARLGCAILAGPYMFAFAAITRDMLVADAMIEVRDTQGLAEAVSRLLASRQEAAGYSARASAWVIEKSGVNARVLAALSPMIGEALHVAHA